MFSSTEPKKLDLRCIYIQNETNDVKSFFFKLNSNKLEILNFIPGQFITLNLNINDKEINRCYTISSSALSPYIISITVKLQKDGIVSNWLHNNLKIENVISATGVFGDFAIDNFSNKKYLFLSGGSGITPSMSMLRSCFDACLHNDIIFIHSARSPNDIIFKKELDYISSKRKNIQVYYICDNIDEEKNWSGVTGYINISILKMFAKDFLERYTYVCGPEKYMNLVKEMLEFNSFNMRQHHQESFTFEEVTNDQILHSKADNTQEKLSFEIKHQTLGKVFSCLNNQTIITAAKENSIHIPYACSQGICGTCKSKKISGEVIMNHQGGILDSEIKEGYFLPCCSIPKTPIIMANK